MDVRGALPYRRTNDIGRRSAAMSCSAPGAGTPGALVAGAGAGGLTACSWPTSRRRDTTKVDPRSGSLLTLMDPPINATSSWQMDSPSPLPPNRRVVDSSACAKGLEDLRDRFIAEADSRIGDRESHIRGPPISKDVAADDDLSFRRELDRIADEIREYLAQPKRIPHHFEVIADGRTDNELQSLGFGDAGEQHRTLFRQPREIHRQGFQQHLARLRLGKIEQIVQYLQKSPARTT